MADPLVFTVRSSSSDELYKLEAYRTATGVRFACTCPAGENGQHCKHRVAMLLGDAASVVEGTEQIAALTEMVAGSPIVAALAKVGEAEKSLAVTQRALKTAKAGLAKALMG